MKKLLITTCLVVQTFVVAGAMAAEPIGQVISLVGQASVTGSDGQAQKLAMKSEVYLNDHIQTKADSRVQIMLADDAIVSLGANSSMKIDEFVYNVRDQNANKTTLSFLKGVFRVITAKVADMNPERFKVKSNMATVGIRGCELCFNIGDDEESVQIVRLPQAKLIRFESLAGFGSFDVRQQGVAVDIDPTGFTQRALTDAEVRALTAATTPPVTDDGVADVVDDTAQPLGADNPLAADAAEVAAGTAVADSGVVIASDETVNREGDADFAIEGVDPVVERISTTADRFMDDLATAMPPVPAPVATRVRPGPRAGYRSRVRRARACHQVRTSGGRCNSRRETGRGRRRT